MNTITDFDIEAIASFDLTLIGQEAHISLNNTVYLLIPFYRLGHYDNEKGLSHNYNLGYFIIEGVKKCKVKTFQYNGGSIDYSNELIYDVMFNQSEKNKEIIFEDIGLRAAGLVSLTMAINYSRFHMAYDFISLDCTPTDFNKILDDKVIIEFLLTHNLAFFRELLDAIKIM